MIIGKIIIIWSVAKDCSPQLGSKPYKMTHASSDVVTNVSVYKAFALNICLISPVFSYKPRKTVLVSRNIFCYRDLCPAYRYVKLCISSQHVSVQALSWTYALSILVKTVYASLWTSAGRFIPNSSFAFRPMWGCKWDVSASFPCFHVPLERSFFSSRGRGQNMLNARILFLAICISVTLNLIGMPLALQCLKEIPAVFPVHPNNWKTCHVTASFNDMHHYSVLL